MLHLRLSFFISLFLILLSAVAFGQSLRVFDIDGNEYHELGIGTQVWLDKNLKTTKYRNGDPIPIVTDKTAWSVLKTGACCDFLNNPGIGAAYGKLYNWYAVYDSRGLAPAGWHVATEQDWLTLINFLGGQNSAGGKLKETGTQHWRSPNTGATDSMRFKALPGGERTQTGDCVSTVIRGRWWSSTAAPYLDPQIPSQPGPRYAVCVELAYEKSSIWKSPSDKRRGLSVRCVKD